MHTCHPTFATAALSHIKDQMICSITDKDTVRLVMSQVISSNHKLLPAPSDESTSHKSSNPLSTTLYPRLSFSQVCIYFISACAVHLICSSKPTGVMDVESCCLAEYTGYVDIYK